jgi:hypothetical protein
MIGNEYAKNAPQVEAAPPAKAVPAAPVWFDEKKGPIATPVADPGVANKP